MISFPLNVECCLRTPTFYMCRESLSLSLSLESPLSISLWSPPSLSLWSPSLSGVPSLSLSGVPLSLSLESPSLFLSGVPLSLESLSRISPLFSLCAGEHEEVGKVSLSRDVTQASAKVLKLGCDFSGWLLMRCEESCKSPYCKARHINFGIILWEKKLCGISECD